MIYGQRMRAIRQQQGMTQESVAARLGITRTQMSNIERGTTDTTVRRLMEIANILGVSPAAFFHGDITAPQADALPFDDVDAPTCDHLPFD